MAQLTKPELPIPEPLRGKEIGTFTHYSIAVRLPEIAQRVLQENELVADVVAVLEKLILREIPNALLRPLQDTAPDTADWQRYGAPYQDQNWLEAPWFFVETYFYRRILEATGYFQPGDGHGVDPFAYQKRQGLETTQKAIRALSEQMTTWLPQPEQKRALFRRLFLIALWGNRADLSLWPADKGGNDHVELGGEEAHILVDETAAIADYLFGLETPTVRVDFIMDNAGFELVCDLCLADFLLSSETAAAVHLHLKSHPTFVSDAMVKDVQQAIELLAADSHQDVGALARRLQEHVEDGRLRLQHHLFWTSPLPFWQMPTALRQELAHSHLIISKGDANYRRLLGDRHWPFTTPFADVVTYAPAPLAALRTLKSEIATGLQPGQPQEMTQKDPDWSTNGQWGLVQFAPEPRPS